jgi:hypothetical protein
VGATTVTYHFTGSTSAYVPNGSFTAELYLGGTAHSVTGDTWSLSTTKGGVTNTASGTFS